MQGSFPLGQFLTTFRWQWTEFSRRSSAQIHDSETLHAHVDLSHPSPHLSSKNFLYMVYFLSNLITGHGRSILFMPHYSYSFSSHFLFYLVFRGSSSLPLACVGMKRAGTRAIQKTDALILSLSWISRLTDTFLGRNAHPLNVLMYHCSTAASRRWKRSLQSSTRETMCSPALACYTFILFLSLRWSVSAHSGPYSRKAIQFPKPRCAGYITLNFWSIWALWLSVLSWCSDWFLYNQVQVSRGYFAFNSASAEWNGWLAPNSLHNLYSSMYWIPVHLPFGSSLTRVRNTHCQSHLRNFTNHRTKCA